MSAQNLDAPAGGQGRDVSSSANLRGAVDLSALSTPRVDGAGAASNGPSPWTVALSEATFPQIVATSAQVPVIIVLTSVGSSESAQVLDLLTQVVDAAAGKLLLATADAGSNPGIAQALGAQTFPTVVALIKSQPVPLFSGSIAPDQLAALLQQLMTLAAQQGVNGTLADAQEVPGQEPELSPLHQEAFDAIEKGDYAAAEKAYRKALDEKPADQDAQSGLFQVGLLKRTADMDAATVRKNGADSPEDLAAQLAVADLDLVGGHVEDAFNRLLGFIQTHRGEERNSARERLVEYFTLTGQDDPRVSQARSKLAALLFA